MQILICWLASWRPAAEGSESGFWLMGMSKGREEENTGNTSCQEEEEEEGGENIGEKRGGEISEGERQSMSTDCASPIGKSSHTTYIPVL